MLLGCISTCRALFWMHSTPSVNHSLQYQHKKQWCYNTSMQSELMLDIQNLSKTYKNGFKALDNVSLGVKKGEIFCLLGANGAGKTTLISCVTGLVQPSGGTIAVDGNDAWDDYRTARSLFSLVPQEITLEIFEKVIDIVSYARGYFGKPNNQDLTHSVLRDVGLWEKRNNKIQELSGGMKRRVLIARALMNEPELLFLDEPTAGVDVELRRTMWEMINEKKQQGMTIFLTTHYLEEAEKYADRIGFISGGVLHFVKKKDDLMGDYPGLSLEDIYVELTKKY